MIDIAAAAELPPEQVGAKAGMLGSAQRAGFLVPPGVVVPPGETVDTDCLLPHIGPGPYAVRSSAPDEDGAGKSHAGQYHSRLSVRLDEIPAAVDALSLTPDGNRIPLLIQPVVRVRTAGVAFSIDPLNGDDTTCVVEVVPGTADALTDGRVVPTTFRMSAFTGRPQGDYRCRPNELDSVVNLVRAVAEWLGYPCDIEWAGEGEQVWLLQARPVTAAGNQALPGQWTSANFRETMPGLVTPLTASITLGQVFPTALAGSLREIGLVSNDAPVTEGRRVYGRAYWRVDILKDVLVQFPGFVERSFDEGVGIEPAYSGPGRRSELSLVDWCRVPRLLVNLWLHHRRVLAGAVAHRDGDRDRDRYWLSLRWDQLPNDELSERVREAIRLHEEAYRHSLRVSFLAEQAQDLLRALLRETCKRHDRPPRESVLLGDLGELRTDAASRALEQLALHTPDKDAVLKARTVDDLPTQVRAELHTIIHQFGYLAEADDELAQPRWDENPTLALALFRAAIRASTHGCNDNLTRRRESRKKEQRQILRAARQWSPVLGSVLRFTRRYSRLREDLRVCASRANRIARHAHVALGERWAGQGILGEADDVFWLTREEVLDTLGSDRDCPNLAARATERRAHARFFRNWEPPATLGTRPGKHSPEPDASMLSGIPCSAGIAEGKVRILLDLGEIGDVETGSILVLRYANPGWAPAYVAASGLVTEEGGLLSHGSILARERGLPAVIGVHGATKRLSDGQRVRIDGTEGTVTVLP